MHNPFRGEVAAEINGRKAIFAAEMQRLAAFSDRMGNPALARLFDRVFQAEPSALLAFADCFIIDSDPAAFKAAIRTIDDLAEMQVVALKVLDAFQKPASGDQKKSETD